MGESNQHGFGDDSPKQNPWEDDRLGFRPFAERLAQVIFNLDVPNGYVIGLHGEWGSGKSTALNFLKAILEKKNQEIAVDVERIHVIDFQPWLISGHQDLITAFFKVLSENLPSTKTEQMRRRSKGILNFFRRAGDPLVDAVATVGVTVDPSGGVAVGTAAAIAKKTLADKLDSFLDAPSLQTAYKNLKDALQTKRRRFLVTIDDLDRLQDEEIKLIMQMVKTIGRLPNVIYLLAYDRSIIWNVFDGKVERVGTRFMEKIVQHELSLPRPSKDALLSILDTEVAFLTDLGDNSLRWNYLVRDGIRRWIRHPRDVLRLANAVRFSWPALEGEIDPQDLLVMEGLCLFDPIAFDWVRWNRDFLFDENSFFMATDDARKIAVQHLKESLLSETHDSTLRLLATLFPLQSKWLANTGGAEPFYEVAARRGVGCIAGYDAYFSLHPSPDVIPKVVVDQTMQSLTDREELIKIFESHLSKTGKNGQPLIGNLLEEIRFRFSGRNAPLPTQDILDALFYVSESVCRLEWRRDPFLMAPRSHLSGLVEDLLGIWRPAEASRHLHLAYKISRSSVTFCATIFVERAREFGVISPSVSTTPLIEKSAFDGLGNMLLPRIANAAETGTLVNAPYYWDILRAWKYLGGAKDAREWLNTEMRANEKFLSKLSIGLVNLVISERGAYSMTDRPDEELYDLEILASSCRKHLASGRLNDDEKQRIATVAEASEAMLKTLSH